MHLSPTYLLVLLIAEKYNPAPRSYCELQLRTMNLTPSVTTSQGPLRHLVVGAQHPEAPDPCLGAAAAAIIGPPGTLRVKQSTYVEADRLP